MRVNNLLWAILSWTSCWQMGSLNSILKPKHKRRKLSMLSDIRCFHMNSQSSAQQALILPCERLGNHHHSAGQRPVWGWITGGKSFVPACLLLLIPTRGTLFSLCCLFPTCLRPLFKRKEKGNFINQHTKSEILGINSIMVLEIERILHSHPLPLHC